MSCVSVFFIVYIMKISGV